jgi:hypothetical protein
MRYKIYQYIFILITTLIIFLALNFLSKKTNFIKSKKNYFIVLSFIENNNLYNDKGILNYVIQKHATENLLVPTVENTRGFISIKYKFKINNKEKGIVEKFKRNLKYVEQNKLKILDAYLENHIQKTINHLNLRLVKDFELNKINRNNIKLTLDNLKCSKLNNEINKYYKQGVIDLAKLQNIINEVTEIKGLNIVCKNIDKLQTLLYLKSNKLTEDILITTMIEYDKQIISDIKEIENKGSNEKTLSYYLRAFIFLIIGFIISQLFWILILQIKLGFLKK